MQQLHLVCATVTFSVCNKSFKFLGLPSGWVWSHEGLIKDKPIKSLKKKKERERKKNQKSSSFFVNFTKQNPWGNQALLKSRTHRNDKETHSITIIII